MQETEVNVATVPQSLFQQSLFRKLLNNAVTLRVRVRVHKHTLSILCIRDEEMASTYDYNGTKTKPTSKSYLVRNIYIHWQLKIADTQALVTLCYTNQENSILQ